MFTVITSHDCYSIDRHGNIRHPSERNPARQWKAMALVAPCGFGISDRLVFSDWTKTTLADRAWRYKNGKPRYLLRDLRDGQIGELPERILNIYCESAVAMERETYPF